ncbi:hypothetical protein HOG21_06450 [bacterium]|jgi:hypothetical protein|nr:hypothetical protein [bacterium]
MLIFSQVLVDVFHETVKVIVGAVLSVLIQPVEALLLALQLGAIFDNKTRQLEHV